jgi:hypothetical protein
MNCLKKLNMNFNVRTPSMFVFLFFTNVVLLKLVYPLKICQHTKFHGRALTGASFASTSEVTSRNFRVVEAAGLKVWHRGRLRWHGLPNKFRKNVLIGSEVIGVTQNGDLISHTFLFEESWPVNGNCCLLGVVGTTHFLRLRWTTVYALVRSSLAVDDDNTPIHFHLSSSWFARNHLYFDCIIRHTFFWLHISKKIPGNITRNRFNPLLGLYSKIVLQIPLSKRFVRQKIVWITSPHIWLYLEPIVTC